ncbi:Retrovirus-related Pol polyprotein [Sparassis crispa]|uniref:Retrovirus-related Pol polyprotein n=1 Tax=Sparassis crispa TaxID=139825 RepID=A0A401GUJ8_9APHY|nr:Retrovirus-related Pol polyprotein [Sparassis crispa]GBE85404.1 Retrovirus-related Pol polyprotein [Sparassis crispa]
MMAGKKGRGENHRPGRYACEKTHFPFPSHPIAIIPTTEIFLATLSGHPSHTSGIDSSPSLHLRPHADLILLILLLSGLRRNNNHVSTEEGQYYQDFTHVTLFLLSRGQLSTYERDRLYLEGFEASPLHAIKNRLAIKVPDQNPDNLYAISKVHSAAQHILSGSGSASSAVAVSKLSTGMVKLEGNETDAMQFLANMLQQAMRTSGGGQALVTQANIQVAVTQNPLPQALHACNFCLAIDHFMRNCPCIEDYIRVRKINRDALSRIILPNGQFVPRDLPGRSMAECVDVWHDMSPRNLFGDGPGPSAAPPPNVSRDGHDQPPHMVSLWEIMKEALNPKEPSLVYIEECLDDSAMSVLEANVALKKKTVQFDDSTAGKSAKCPPGVPASQVPASILKPASDPSAAPRGGAKASLPSAGNRTMQYSYKTPVEDKVNVQDIFERIQNEVRISLTHRELMALCPEICKLEKEEITVKRVAMMGSFKAADGEEVAKALLVDVSDGGGPLVMLGHLTNIQFGFSEMELYLQAHVLNDAPFEVLLGRLFFTLTACKTLDFTNGHIGKRSLVDGRVPHIPESASSVSSLSSSMAAFSSLSSSMNLFPSLSSFAASVSSLSSSEELFPRIVSLQIEEPHVLYTLSSSFCSIGAASGVTTPAVAPGAFQIEHEAVVHGYEYEKVDNDGFLWEEEVKLFDHILYLHEQAFAWDESEKGKFSDEYFKPIRIPYQQHVPWALRNIPLLPGIREQVIQVIRDKIASGVYEPSNSSYRSHWFCILKKDGKSLRLVHDLQPLSAIVIRDSAAPPQIEDIAEAFGGCFCYASFDLFIAFDQRTLHPDSHDLTTFQSLLGALRLTTIPMGYTNSVQIMHGDVTFILQDEIPHVTIPYIDNVPVKNGTT